MPNVGNTNATLSNEKLSSTILFFIASSKRRPLSRFPLWRHICRQLQPHLNFVMQFFIPFRPLLRLMSRSQKTLRIFVPLWDNQIPKTYRDKVLTLPRQSADTVLTKTRQSRVRFHKTNVQREIGPMIYRGQSSIKLAHFNLLTSKNRRLDAFFDFYLLTSFFFCNFARKLGIRANNETLIPNLKRQKLII